MFSLIVAHSKNKAIGLNNQIPWFLPSDLKRFKELTTGKTIVMGRKTFQSLPGLLPNRKHIVLSRNKSFANDNPKVTVLTNINEFIKNNKDSSEEIFIIGGSEIYKIFYPYAKKLYITEVNLEIDGDTFFLEIDKNLWKLDFQSPIQIENSIEFTYKNYSK